MEKGDVKAVRYWSIAVTAMIGLALFGVMYLVFKGEKKVANKI